MKMKAILVAYFLFAEALFILADQKIDSKVTSVKKIDDIKLGDINITLEEKSPDAQRRRDSGYHYNKQNRFTTGNQHGFGRHGYRGRIVTRLQSQVNRPFKQYGPPNQEGTSFNPDNNQPTSTDSLVNQEVPSSIRQNDFSEASPIASQNNQPFGQHTANYLPPKNQKLPAYTSPHLFSNVNHDFPQHHQLHQQQQQQQQQEQQQQQQQLQQQQQYLQQLKQQQQQPLQVENQNFLNQEFNVPNSNFGQNAFTNQQISDATLFLTQNAEAISDLYGAPAANQNYAPNNQEFEQIDQQQLQGGQSLNLQVSGSSQSQEFPSQLPSYASGLLNSQETLEKIQSLEKDRLIAQLQQALSNRETSARFAHNINNYPQSENLATATSQYATVNNPSNSQQGLSFLPTTTLSSLGFQGFYGASNPVTTTPTPVTSTLSTTTTSTLQPSQGSSGAGSTQVGSSLPASGTVRPTVVNPGFPQYGGFTPTFVSTTGFVPSVPTFGTTLFPTTVLKPTDNSPTYFGIPIPTFQGQKPTRPPPSTTPATIRPPSSSPHPSRPTLSIPLGPVRPVLTPAQHPIVRPNPVPVVPAATPVHPTYGIHPAVVNPAFVYKPVNYKPVFPVYYYPNVGYQSVHKPVDVPASLHPWNYAPSFTQAKPTQIWN